MLSFEAALVSQLCRPAWRRCLLSADSGGGLKVIEIPFARSFMVQLHHLLLAHVLHNFREFSSDIEKFGNHLIGGTIFGRDNSLRRLRCFFFFHLNYFAIF